MNKYNLFAKIYCIVYLYQQLCSTKNHAEREASFQLKERLMNFQNRNPLEDWTVDEVCFQVGWPITKFHTKKKKKTIYQNHICCYSFA